jgi:hypothetical protein
MTEYHIKTPTGKDGPFSVEELRKKKIKPETMVSENGTEWTQAGMVEPLRPMFQESAISGSKKPGRQGYSISDEQPKEASSRSRISMLQYTAFVLLILNGVVYYYKQQNPTSEKRLEVSAAPAVIKKLPGVRIAVEHKSTGMADRTAKADTTIKIRNNWSTFIKAVPNDFKHYKRGGIHHLQAIVQNKTGFPLDTVKLAVNYIRRGQTFKTEFLTLVNIPEHGEISVPAPDSRGGTAVKVDFTEISSQKMQFFYNVGLQSEGKDDPYFKL